MPKVDIMSLNTQKADSLSGIEYLSLAVQAASNLRSHNVVIPVSVAQQIMKEIAERPSPFPSVKCPKCETKLDHFEEAHECAPPPLPITTLTPQEVSRRVGRIGSNPLPTYAKPMPPANPPSPSERAALRDAGRGRLLGL